MPTEQRLVTVVEEVNLCTTLGIFCVVKNATALANTVACRWE